MSKKIVVSFPGGRGTEIPLLYFCAKKYEDMGYEKVFVNHPLEWDESLESLLENAEKVISTINFSDYEEIIFIAKSIGTLVACKIKEKHNVPAKVILFTPLEGTLPYINCDNDIVYVAIGSKDRYLDYKVLSNLCAQHNINCHVEPDVGHRMEVMNDLERNLEIISNVINQER